MLPKNSKHYIVPTAEDLDVSSALVEDVVGFYYSTLRKTLGGLESPIVQVENLGSFNAKAKELPKLVAKYTKHLSVLKPETFNQMSTKKNVENKLEEVLALQQKITDEKKRRTQFNIKKYGQSTPNMGKQKKDI
jgi:predicted RNase H-like nuclease (RuvC/YqgF family)